jgi:hypothetical protein
MEGKSADLTCNRLWEPLQGKSADLTCNRLWEPLQGKRLNTDNNLGVSYANEYIYPAIVVILSTNKWVQIYFSVIYSWT